MLWKPTCGYGLWPQLSDLVTAGSLGSQVGRARIEVAVVVVVVVRSIRLQLCDWSNRSYWALASHQIHIVIAQARTAGNLLKKQEKCWVKC